MYRLRTADKGKPLIIADDVIREYSDCHVDTLHKKNLLSLGEDRFLTTLMTSSAMIRGLPLSAVRRRYMEKLGTKS